MFPKWGCIVSITLLLVLLIAIAPLATFTFFLAALSHSRLKNAVNPAPERILLFLRFYSDTQNIPPSHCCPLSFELGNCMEERGTSSRMRRLHGRLVRVLCVLPGSPQVLRLHLQYKNNRTRSKDSAESSAGAS